MKHLIKLIFPSLILALSSYISEAQVQITFDPQTIQQPELVNPFAFTLNNPKTSFEGKIELVWTASDGQIVYQAKVNKAAIPSGISHSDYTPIDYEILLDQRSILKSLGTIDQITQCVRVYNQQTLAAEKCEIISVIPKLTPILVTPFNHSEADNNTLFSWLLAFAANQHGEIKYHFKICEIYSNQSAQEALESNTILFEQNDLTESFIYYPQQAPRLETSKSYAWQVSVSKTNSFKAETYTKENKALVGVSPVWVLEPQDPNEPKIDPMYYIEPQAEANNKTLYCLNFLHIKFQSEYVTGSARIRFFDDRNNVIDYEVMKEVKKGDNRYDINLQETHLFEHKKIYTIEFTTPEGNKKYMNIKYFEKR
jgi:hypothetical protein